MPTGCKEKKKKMQIRGKKGRDGGAVVRGEGELRSYVGKGGNVERPHLRRGILQGGRKGCDGKGRENRYPEKRYISGSSTREAEYKKKGWKQPSSDFHQIRDGGKRHLRRQRKM